MVNPSMSIAAGPYEKRVCAVNHQATIETRDALFGLGFQPDEKVLSDISPGQSFDFGNFTLRASCCLSPRFVEIVFFTGVLSTARSLAEVLFEMPRKVNSLKQCAAWIVWNLDQLSDDGVFSPARYVSWIEEGRENRTLLPWIKRRGAYNSRPACIVRRDWLRLALKTLGEQVSSLPDSAAVLFSFDGSMLFIRCEGKVVALPGEGPPWAVRFSVEAGHLRRLPKRLMRDCIDVSIWESRLTIASHSYEGTIDG